MAVYVDPLRECTPNSGWRWKQSCHMIADTPEELHAFAKKIGLKREWFQQHSIFDHYDLTVRRRKLAVQHGAVEVNMTWLKERIRAKRNGQSQVPDRPGVDGADGGPNTPDDHRIED